MFELGCDCVCVCVLLLAPSSDAFSQSSMVKLYDLSAADSSCPVALSLMDFPGFSGDAEYAAEARSCLVTLDLAIVVLNASSTSFGRQARDAVRSAYLAVGKKKSRVRVTWGAPGLTHPMTLCMCADAHPAQPRRPRPGSIEGPTPA